MSLIKYAFVDPLNELKERRIKDFHDKMERSNKKKEIENMAKQMEIDGFSRVESNNSFWNPQVIGEYIEGELKKKVDGDFGTICIINTKDGEVTTPSHKVLQNRLSKVDIGTFVRIVMTGEELPKIKGHNPTKLYEVYTKKK